MRAVFVVALLCALTAVASLQETEDARMVETVTDGLREEASGNAEMIADINAAAEQLRAEKAADTSRTKGFFCKKIKETEPAHLDWITRFMNSKYGQWVPQTQKTLSIYLQAEAGASAFVGIGVGVGIGVDFTLNTDRKGATGKVKLFACLSGSITVGYMGAKASAGGGLYIGFGENFERSIGAATFELGFDIQAGPAPLTVGIGILVRLGDKDKAGFMKGWSEYQKKEVPPNASKKQEYLTKVKNVFGRIAKGLGQELKAFCPNIRVTGVALHVGAGVGSGYKTEVAVDVEPLISGLKTGFAAVWKKLGFKKPAWVTKINETMNKIKNKIKPKSNHYDANPANDDD